MTTIRHAPMAVTFTTRDSLNSSSSLKDLLLRSMRFIGTWLDKATVKWELYPELTPDRGLLHYHGTVYIKDSIKWAKFVHQYNSHYGFMYTKPINRQCEDEEPDEYIDGLVKWKIYCEKDWINMFQILGLYKWLQGPEDHLTHLSWKRIIGPMAL